MLRDGVQCRLGWGRCKWGYPCDGLPCLLFVFFFPDAPLVVFVSFTGCLYVVTGFFCDNCSLLGVHISEGRLGVYFFDDWVRDYAYCSFRLFWSFFGPDYAYYTYRSCCVGLSFFLLGAMAYLFCFFGSVIGVDYF